MLAAARNCTVHPISSDEAVGWQPGSCYRGTWNIVSTCLSTIIACTWSIQHLNIPATDDSGWEKNKRKMKWMIITVLFPELVLIHAMFEFHMAWKALRLMEENKKSVEWPWWSRKPTLSWLPSRRRCLDSRNQNPESQPANDLESGDVKNLERQHDDNFENQDNTDESKKPKWTLAHCYFANMGGFMYVNGEGRLLATAQHLAEAKDLSYANPETTVEDIKDKSKQDWLAKLFAALQISQLILSVITRHIQGVHFSQLETVTLSFAICGVLIYWTYFHKPQKIERPVEFRIDTPLSNDVSTNRAGDAQKATDWISSLQSEKTFDSLWAIMLNKQPDFNETDSLKHQKAPRIPNDNIPMYKSNTNIHPAVYLLALASGLFGAIHAIAWNFEFPTEAEKLLWKIATCISAASPVVGLVTIPFTQLTKSSGDHELFALNCLRLMQEYSWHALPNVSQVSKAIKELEDAIATDASKKYSKIFGEMEPNTFIDLRNFLDLKGRFKDSDWQPFEPLDDKLFSQSFHRLIKSLRGENLKKINEAAWTKKWPRKSLLPPGVNQCILYLTGVLYCASRLIILAISFSSLRKMPGSVYIATNWTEYMPTFGAMGG